MKVREIVAMLEGLTYEPMVLDEIFEEKTEIAIADECSVLVDEDGNCSVMDWYDSKEVVVENNPESMVAAIEEILEKYGYRDEMRDEPWDGFNSDAEADADVLAGAGWGTDEDYGYYGGDE